jgi:hypothetical protein
LKYLQTGLGPIHPLTMTRLKRWTRPSAVAVRPGYSEEAKARQVHAP